MLARLLTNAGIDVVVYEGSSERRHDGGTLDLHTDTGLAAMKKAGLHDEFLKHARFDGESLLVTDRLANTVLDMGGAKNENSTRGRPEIDRPALLDTLLDSLPEDMIQWSHKLRSVDEDLTLHFDGETASGFDLVVGCDGAWSKVRPLVSPSQPEYSGVAGFQGYVPEAKQNAPELYELVRRGSLFAIGQRSTFMLQQMGDGRITWAAWQGMRASEEAQAPKEDSAKFIEKYASNFSPKLVGASRHTDSVTTCYRVLYMLPVGHRWQHRRGVTLIGDAAHLMTPFAGEGVNLALADAMNLADEIIKASAISGDADKSKALEALDNRVQRFEETMFERATATQALTAKMKDNIFAEGEAWDKIEGFIITAASDEVPFFIRPFFSAAVYIYFFFKKLFKRPKTL